MRIWIERVFRKPGPGTGPKCMLKRCPRRSVWRLFGESWGGGLAEGPKSVPRRFGADMVLGWLGVCSWAGFMNNLYEFGRGAKFNWDGVADFRPTKRIGFKFLFVITV